MSEFRTVCYSSIKKVIDCYFKNQPKGLTTERAIFIQPNRSNTQVTAGLHPHRVTTGSSFDAEGTSLSVDKVVIELLLTMIFYLWKKSIEALKALDDDSKSIKLLSQTSNKANHSSFQLSPCQQGEDEVDRVFTRPPITWMTSHRNWAAHLSTNHNDDSHPGHEVP